MVKLNISSNMTEYKFQTTWYNWEEFWKTSNFM